MDYNKTARDIFQSVGGDENVQKVFHCMTRLRFLLQDQSKVDQIRLESVSSVLGTNISGNQFQVIIGNDVSIVYKAIQEISKFNNG